MILVKSFNITTGEVKESFLPVQEVPVPEPVPPTQAQIDALRLSAYQSESDPLFFKYQRDEIDKQVWLDKVEEIRQRYPDVE